MGTHPYWRKQVSGQNGLGLSPELLDRLKRIAKAQARTPEQVLSDAVLEYWIRFATRNKLKQEEW
jgi:predicted transcriptional regulator